MNEHKDCTRAEIKSVSAERVVKVNNILRKCQQGHFSAECELGKYKFLQAYCELGAG